MDTSGTTKSSPVFCYVRKYTLTAVTLLSSMTWLTLCYLSSYRDAVQYTTFQPPNPQIYKRNTSELGEFSCSGGKRILIPPSVFSPNGYPITALSTAPGSGTGWTLHLLEELTGKLMHHLIYFGWDQSLKTHSIAFLYSTRDRFFSIAGYYTGDMHTLIRVHNSSVVVIKAHYPFLGQHPPVFRRAIVLTRDPADSCIAEFNRQHGDIKSANGSIKRGHATRERLWNL